ncbi:MAG: UDP-3-O-(3-hydroxymyristoyl) glucosamine N-acyltransferase, partial [Candidatus Cloacimonetes bacterium]|nr:UDP-3-O-(3-hydroxymyristoyl) glucosamine N-acyltransferase [Candidatus Cloacimonadota bacterium]
MKKFNKTITPEDIVAVCGGEYHGEQNITLQSVADPEEADSSSVIFWEQEKYLDAVKKSPAVLIFCHPDKANNLPNRNLILHPHPYFAFLRLVDWWIEQDAEKPIPEIHPTAIIDSSAIIGDGVYIGPY